MVNIVHCNNIRSNKAGFLEVKKSGPPQLFFWCSPSSYLFVIPAIGNRSHHMLFLLKINCDKIVFVKQKWLYGCYRSQSYSQTYMPRSWQFFSILLGVFHDNSTSDQLVSRTVFSCFPLKTTKTYFYVTAWPLNSNFAANCHLGKKRFEWTATKSPWP